MPYWAYVRAISRLPSRRYFRIHFKLWSILAETVCCEGEEAVLHVMR